MVQLWVWVGFVHHYSSTVTCLRRQSCERSVRVAYCKQGCSWPRGPGVWIPLATTKVTCEILIDRVTPCQHSGACNRCVPIESYHHLGKQWLPVQNIVDPATDRCWHRPTVATAWPEPVEIQGTSAAAAAASCWPTYSRPPLLLLLLWWPLTSFIWFLFIFYLLLENSEASQRRARSRWSSRVRDVCAALLSRRQLPARQLPVSRRLLSGMF